jgi:hypothetical protein
MLTHDAWMPKSLTWTDSVRGNTLMADRPTFVVTFSTDMYRLESLLWWGLPRRSSHSLFLQVTSHFERSLLSFTLRACSTRTHTSLEAARPTVAT